MRRITAKAPDLTTATACSRAVTGVGATEAAGSQPWKGKIAALTPKPKKASTKTVSNSFSWPATLSMFKMPPRVKSRESA